MCFGRNIKLEQEIGGLFQRFIHGEITIKDILKWCSGNIDDIFDAIDEEDETSNLLLRDAVEVLEDMHDTHIQLMYIEKPELLQEITESLLGYKESKYRLKPSENVIVEIRYTASLGES